MGYLEDLKVQINNRDFAKFWQLWEEYCTSDTVDVEEFIQILKAIKNSDFAKQFGQYVETALPVWETITDPQGSYDVLKLLIDLQASNSPQLAELALKALKNTYGEQPQFNERLRLVGLRTKENFQGALSNYDLLSHMDKGRFVFHLGGWGTGEIVDISPIREQVGIEFENISGCKYFSFSNAFKTLIPLADNSFLARRFAKADELEQEARENPVAVIKLLLQDLGPKSATEIKDELCDLVIPEKDWAKWWSNARAKIKKDTMIESPEALKEPFRLHKAAVSHEERFHKAIGKQSGIDDLIQTSYAFFRDNPAMLKKSDVVDSIKEKILAALKSAELTEAQELQMRLFLETQFDHHVDDKTVKKQIQSIENFEELLDQIDIIAFKKRLLILIRESRDDWSEIFLSLLYTPQQSTVRDYLLKELNQGETKVLLIEKLRGLVTHPMQAPEFLVWYFQKIMGKEKEGLPFGDKDGQGLFFEAFLILFAALDSKPEYKDLTKKMYLLLSGKRYALVRAALQGTSLAFVQEFLLLVAKCQAFSDHDLKILRSLAEVVHPSLNPHKHQKEQASFDHHVLWTTESGYQRTHQRMIQISTTEMVENAREVEAARALGDLRENSEYKFALEKRSRLQSELKHLAEQINRARIITSNDISNETVGVGAIVEVADSSGKNVFYTILGPWDADPEKGILSAQSKFAQAMFGHRPGEKFNFKDEEYTIISLKSFLDKR
jgi:transcription elongation factor GreA-like protein/transcription elongation GreA/GreB family factor